MRTRIAVAACAVAVLATPAADAGCPAGDNAHERVELTDADVDEIHTLMVGNEPVLAASPGVKAVEARCARGLIYATVYFYPHTEKAGIGEAVKAHCERAADGGPWDCPRGELRLYVQVPGQDFPVRISGQLDYETAIALIDATRGKGPVRTDAGIATDTAVLITGGRDAMWVGWGDREGHLAMSVHTRLIEGADPREARSWEIVEVDAGD